MLYWIKGKKDIHVSEVLFLKFYIEFKKKHSCNRSNILKILYWIKEKTFM